MWITLCLGILEDKNAKAFEGIHITILFFWWCPYRVATSKRHFYLNMFKKNILLNNFQNLVIYINIIQQS